MKEKKRSPRRLLRRVVPLAVGALLLRGVYAGLDSLPLPTLLGEDSGAELAQTLLETELAPYMEDESSIWESMVTTELPLYGLTAEDGYEETILPATDSLPAEEAPGEADPAPEETAEPAGEDGGSATAQTITTNSNTIVGTINVNNNTSGITVDPAALCASTLTQTIRPASEGPQILIMHTHGSEAYTMAGEDVYAETDTSRTDDPNYNMIRIGEEMKAVFESMGFSVIHDTTLYDYPSYTGSYTRSLAGIQSYLEQYPTIAVVLDVHRDALISGDGTVYKAVTDLNGESVAQVMLVCGTNDGGLNHPNWQQNLNLAAHIQMGMTAISPTLARPINLRSQRFNQHLTACSLLVEVGTSGNTLQEAIRGARYFAQAAGEVYQTLVAAQ